jgi:hypothetical protein
MPVPSISTWGALQANIAASVGIHELIFVNGRPYEGGVSFNRMKGMGWESGRTGSIYITPPVDPSSEVILVDLRYLRLRHCQLRVPTDRIDIKIAEKNNKQEWEAIDLPEDQRSDD